MKLTSRNPSNKSVIFEVEELTLEEIDLKIDLSSETFANWRTSTFETRAILLENLGRELTKRKSELAKLVSLEVGQPIKAVYGEIDKCISLTEYYKVNLATMLSDNTVETEATESYIKYEPLGPILGIAPWNFPYWMAFRFIIPTLVGGNTVMLKHSSNVSQCAIAIEEVMLAAGFPVGIFQTLLVSSKNINHVIESDKVKGVSFSGSGNAGSKVASLASSLIKPTLLELGGNDAFIVLGDADIDSTAKTLVDNRLRNAGQACNSPKRVFVQDEIFDLFQQAILEKLSLVKIGDPLDESTEMGPIATEAGLTEVQRQLKTSVDSGARIIIGGGAIASLSQGLFFEPTVVIDVKPGMPLFNEEVFGPVISLIRFKSIPEVITMANQSDFGLGASIWSKDIALAKTLISELEVGNVFINQPVRSDPRLPYGGIKKSGYGRELSTVGIKAFMNVKSVVVK